MEQNLMTNLNASDKFRKSIERYERSRHVLAGGVSSSLRATAKPFPLFFASGAGANLRDVDGNSFIDYTLAWGPLILGHCDARLTEALTRQIATLQQVGAQHDLEWQVAEQICKTVPCADKVLFSNTGTEAVQTAIRLARGYTGRNRIIRFEGHYHGWADNALVGYRPQLQEHGSSQLALPSAGVNPAVLEELIVLPWNDLEVVERALKLHGQQVAGMITEPILCNSGCLKPKPGYLEGLRELATRFGVVLIFDEVITGFRVARGGAQELFGVSPDLATYAKAVAGGLPLSVVAGRQEIMQLVEQRKVVHAGTYNGNPLSLAAAHVVLGILDENGGSVLAEIRLRGETLMQGLRDLARATGLSVLVNGVGSVFHLFFTNQKGMDTYADTLHADLGMRDRFVQGMLDAGILLLPDGRWYISAAHTEDHVKTTLKCVAELFEQLAISHTGTAAGDQ
jgi:glutamate-1-semialdehyde 2,1-aminomutase